MQFSYINNSLKRQRIIKKMNEINTDFLNDVKQRFLPLPRNATEELEHEPNITDFEIKKELGIGSYGKVYLVIHKKTKAEYALKRIDKLDKINQEDKANFIREVEIMYKLNHPNICKLYSHFEDNNYCYLLMQYISNGDAFDLIPKNGKKQENMKLVASIVKDLICAIYYMHNMNPKIMHRDIKPENILLDENNNAYLIDFGWSNYIINHRRRYTICGTPFYLPPEMVNEKGHDENADIWSIGVLLYELITGKVPFEGNNIQEVANNIVDLKIKWPSDINPDAKDLISKILRLNQDERLSIEKILTHKFFSKYFPNAINDLIKPDKIKYKIFVVSTDDPKTWNLPNPKKSFNKINTNIDRNDKNLIKKTTTLKNYKTKFELSPKKYGTNNILEKMNNNKISFVENNENNENKNIQKNYYSNNNLKYCSNYKIENKYNNHKNKYNKADFTHYSITSPNIVKKRSNNNMYISSNLSNKKYTYLNNINKNYNKKHTISYDNRNENDDFSILSKKYDLLKKEYDAWKNNELKKLESELRNINIKINRIINRKKSYDFRNNTNEINYFKNCSENLKLENNELKEKIKIYSNYLNNIELYNSKKEKSKSFISNDKINGEFDIKEQMNINNIIKAKEKQINNYKKEIKDRIMKEKERFALLINKYDKTLISQERENKQLKNKLKELERHFY